MIEISRKVPNLEDLWGTLRILSPASISIKFDPKSRVPIAAVCLNDCLSVIGEAAYALREAYAHEAWYKQESEKPNEATSNYFVMFYTDDAALRMYAASEHLATAIIEMLEIGKWSLRRYRKKGTSVSSTVGKYLLRRRPRHPVTAAIAALIGSDDWLKSMAYRDKWVHDQPALVSGFGLQWLRKPRWEEIKTSDDATGHRMLLGGRGDPPEYTVEELRAFVTRGLTQFVETLRNVTIFYISLLSTRGITLSGTTLKVKIN